MYRHLELPPTDKLWAEAMKWASEALNRTATTANPESKSPFDMWYGKAEPASPHPFLQPCVVRKQRRGNKLELKGEVAFYIGPSVQHPSDCVRVVTRDIKILESRDVSWAEVLPAVSFPAVPPSTAPPPVVLQITDQGGLVGPNESGGRNKEEDGAGVSALRPPVEEGGVPLPPIHEDGGEGDDAGDIIDCATGPNSSGEGADDASGNVQPGASPSSQSDSRETS